MKRISMLYISAFAEASAFAKATVDKSAGKRCSMLVRWLVAKILSDVAVWGVEVVMYGG